MSGLGVCPIFLTNRTVSDSVDRRFWEWVEGRLLFADEVIDAAAGAAVLEAFDGAVFLLHDEAVVGRILMRGMD